MCDKLILFSVKREVKKLYFMIRDLKVLRRCPLNNLNCKPAFVISPLCSDDIFYVILKSGSSGRLKTSNLGRLRQLLSNRELSMMMGGQGCSQFCFLQHPFLRKSRLLVRVPLAYIRD